MGLLLDRQIVGFHYAGVIVPLSPSFAFAVDMIGAAVRRSLR